MSRSFHDGSFRRGRSSLRGGTAVRGASIHGPVVHSPVVHSQGAGRILRGLVRNVVTTGLLLLPIWAAGGTVMPLAGAVQVAFLQCGCLCVEGVPQTLCSSVEEAQQRPGLCGQQHCPEYVAVEEQGERYVSPHAYAENCRDVRVWDAAREVYDGIKVCDVLELTAEPTRG